MAHTRSAVFSHQNARNTKTCPMQRQPLSFSSLSLPLPRDCQLKINFPMAFPSRNHSYDVRLPVVFLRSHSPIALF